MSEQDRSEVRTHLGRAGRQSRHAAKNLAHAAGSEASLIADEIEGAADEVAETAKHINVRGLSSLTGDAGTGFLALSVALYAGVIAYNKFGAVVKGRGRAVSP